MSITYSDEQQGYISDTVDAYRSAYFGQKKTVALNGPGGAGKTTATAGAMHEILAWLKARENQLRNARHNESAADFVPVDALRDDTDPRWQIIAPARDSRAKKAEREDAKDHEFATAVDANFAGGIDAFEL